GRGGGAAGGRRAPPTRSTPLPSRAQPRPPGPGPGRELPAPRASRPGAPPKTIAWKVPARRDRLITKEFESEVPVRCTLFVDASQATRVASPVGRRRPGAGKPLDRLLELAVGVLQANASPRHLTGPWLFDDQQVLALLPPDRSPRHHNAMLNQLADAAALAPAAARVNPDELTPLAYALAQELYPELLHPSVNAMPGWRTWFVPSPRYSR